MRLDWTIDTYVLYNAAKNDFDSITLLFGILSAGHLVSFDFEGHIEKEYRRCMKRTAKEKGNDLLKKWFAEIVAKSAQKFCGKLDKRHKTEFQKLEFDPSDWPFVAVCAYSSSKNLVAEESDYNNEVKLYVKEQMSITVLSVRDSNILLR